MNDLKKRAGEKAEKILGSNRKMSYKSGNPLKKLLSHKRATVHVGGW